jgi:hypothetical protein
LSVLPASAVSSSFAEKSYTFDMDASSNSQPLPTGFTALGIFFFFGAAMALLAGCTLLWPGSALDRAWQLNPNAHMQMAPIGRKVGLLFLLLSVVLLLTGIGWLKRRRWGWVLAVIIMITELLGGLMNIYLGEYVRGLVGAVIVAALLFYMFRPAVRGVFDGGAASSI